MADVVKKTILDDIFLKLPSEINGARKGQRVPCIDIVHGSSDGGKSGEEYDPKSVNSKPVGKSPFAKE